MPNQITRDIYVTKNVLKNPIHYVRGTDLIPIVMRFCDFTIPSGATARIFVGKPDGNAVYTSATIEGNTVTIDVTEQMFVTIGLALMQVSIMDGDEELVTFAQPVMVEPNLKAGDFPESSTDITFLDDAIEQANEAVETATTAAQKAATAVQNANTAISNANKAITDVNQAVASMNANFANLAQVATINALQTTEKTVVGAINEINSNSNNKEIISAGLVPEKCNIVEGGYTEIGSIVVINIRLEFPNKINQNDIFNITGFPIPKKESGKYQNNVPCCVNVPRFNSYIKSTGVLTLSSLQELSAPLNVLVGAVYVKA